MSNDKTEIIRCCPFCYLASEIGRKEDAGVIVRKNVVEATPKIVLSEQPGIKYDSIHGGKATEIRYECNLGDVGKECRIPRTF